MLIVSKFHDYYDTAAVYGIDKTIVYRRTERDVKLKIAKLPWIRYNEHRPRRIDIFNRVIGFCGRYIPYIKIEWTVAVGIYSYHFYEAEKLIQFMELNKIDAKSYYYGSREVNLNKYNEVKNFFQNVEPYNILSHLWYQHKTPVWRYNDNKNLLTLDPCLKDCEFFKMVAPPQAFQDIQSYISGVLGVDSKPMIEVSDEVKAASRGHDGKYSFRKPPGKRGNPKWR